MTLKITIRLKSNNDYHKFNYDFKSHINFKETKGRHNSNM
jgi:hypothetical protein